MGDRRLTKKDWWFIGGLTLVALLLRFINLEHPKEIIFDETYFANFAHDYLTHTKFFDAEPPLAKFLIAGGIKIFGFDSFGWRFMPALFGTAVIPLIYLLTKKLFGGWRIPAIAGFLALADGLLLVESRTAVIDIFVVFFNLLTYVLFLMSLQARKRANSFWLLLAAGVSFGLGLSVKWIALACLGPIVALLFFLYFNHLRWIKRLFKTRSNTGLFQVLGIDRKNLHNPLMYLLLLGVLPLTIYYILFAIHVPFDSTGESWWGIHKQIFNYHHHLKATHPYGSAWYTWPVMERPVLYYFKSPPGQWAATIAMGNPLIWWAGILAMIYAVVEVVRRRSLVLFFVVLAFTAHFGPWALIHRVLFIYHYLAGLPFVIIALAYLLGRNWQWRPKDVSIQVFTWGILVAAGAVIGGLLAQSAYGNLGTLTFIVGAAVVTLLTSYFALTDVKGWSWGQKQTIVFLSLVGLAFIYFYPLWTGLALGTDDFHQHLWLKSWI